MLGKRHIPVRMAVGDDGSLMVRQSKEVSRGSKRSAEAAGGHGSTQMGLSACRGPGGLSSPVLQDPDQRSKVELMGSEEDIRRESESPGIGRTATGWDVPGQPGKSHTFSNVDLSDVLCRLLGAGDAGQGRVSSCVAGGGTAPVAGGAGSVPAPLGTGGLWRISLGDCGIWFSVLRVRSRCQLRLPCGGRMAGGVRDFGDPRSGGRCCSCGSYIRGAGK